MAWKQSPGFMPKDRCLKEYILPTIKEKYLPLDDASIQALKAIPCVFAYEKSCDEDAYIGWITNITVRQHDVRIDFELTGDTIDHSTFLGLSRFHNHSSDGFALPNIHSI